VSLTFRTSRLERHIASRQPEIREAGVILSAFTPAYSGGGTLLNRCDSKQLPVGRELPEPTPELREKPLGRCPSVLVTRVLAAAWLAARPETRSELAMENQPS
jgi:hypothetical protein